MASSKSPLYTALAFFFALIVLAGGAAKFYRGVSAMAKSSSDPKVRELLEKSDKAAEEANQQSNVVAPMFQELFTEFDRLGLTAFRAEKREACQKVIDHYKAISGHLQEASKSMIEATQLGTETKITDFLMARSKSYGLLIQAAQKNQEIVSAAMDESLADTDAVLNKIEALANSRDADHKAANEAAAEADAILKKS
jgi:hypothetical protein